VLVTLVGDQGDYAWPSSVADADWRPLPDDGVVDNSASSLTAPPLRLIAAGDEACRALLGRFSHQVKGKVRFDRYERDGRLVAVVAVHAAVSKERALDLLCARWGLGAAQAMAVGDNSVDLGMLHWAGIGVAMGNAPLQMRKGVEWVAPSNDEAGVAWAIERFVLNDSATP